MAFCSKCGAQLEGNERFCVKCGNEVGAVPAAVPAATPVAPAAVPPVIAPVAVPPAFGVPAAPPVAPPPYGMPGQMGAPGQIPVVLGAPPAPAKKGGGWIWGLLIVAAVLYGLYYIGSHNPPPGQGGTQPAGTAPQPGIAPSATPVAQNPGAAPGPAAPVQPNDPGPGGPNEALVQMQSFAGSWRAANGYVEIYNAKWTNRSNVNLSAAVLECDQYAQNGEVLSQQRANLTGENHAGGSWVPNNSFTMGQIVQGLNNVNCGIVGVTPAS